MKNLTQRQQRLSKKIKNEITDTSTINDSLADSAAILITQIEECNDAINKHGVLIITKGSRNQTTYKENPACLTREKSIKQLNILARTLKIDMSKHTPESELNNFLNDE